MHWVISVRLEKRSRALLGSNLTRGIQVEGAPKVHPASGGRRSPEAIFGSPSDTRVMPAKIPRRSRVFHRVLVAYCRQFTMMRTLFPDDPLFRPRRRWNARAMPQKIRSLGHQATQNPEYPKNVGNDEAHAPGYSLSSLRDLCRYQYPSGERGLGIAVGRRMARKSATGGGTRTRNC